MVRAERRVLFETVLSLERGRGQGITVYKIDLVFFIHFKPHSVIFLKDKFLNNGCRYNCQRRNPVRGSEALPPLARTRPIPVR